MNIHNSVTYTFINIKSWSYLGFFEVEGASSSSLSSVCLRLLFKLILSNWTSSVSKPPSIPDIVGEFSLRISQAFCEMVDTSTEHASTEPKMFKKYVLVVLGGNNIKDKEFTYLYFHK